MYKHGCRVEVFAFLMNKIKQGRKHSLEKIKWIRYLATEKGSENDGSSRRSSKKNIEIFSSQPLALLIVIKSEREKLITYSGIKIDFSPAA